MHTFAERQCVRRPRAGWFHTYVYAPVAYGLTGLFLISLIFVLSSLLLSLLWYNGGRYARFRRAVRAPSRRPPPPPLVVRGQASLPPFAAWL